MAPYYLISDVYDRKFKYYRTPRVFAVEIRKYHQKNPLEKFYEIEQCEIAINYKLGILEQCKQTIAYYIQQDARSALTSGRWIGHRPHPASHPTQPTQPNPPNPTHPPTYPTLF
jgi:hypothetical protein